MKFIVIRYSCLLFLLLAAFKSLEYAFFSHKITLDLYLGITALAFLIVGAIAIRLLWPRVEVRQVDSTKKPEPDPELLGSFSPREREILKLLGKGYTNKEIASILHLSPNTIKSHLKSLYSKLDVSNRTQAASEAKLLNLL